MQSGETYHVLAICCFLFSLFFLAWGIFRQIMQLDMKTRVLMFDAVTKRRVSNQAPLPSNRRDIAFEASDRLTVAADTGHYHC